MRKGEPNRLAAALVLSALLHAGLLAMTALVAPRFDAPAVEAFPDPPITPVILTPRTRVAPAAPPRLALHRPARRNPSADVAPLVTAEAEAPAPAEPPPPALSADLRRALTRNTLGCVDLTGKARDDCLDRMGRATTDVPYSPGLGLSAKKRAELDAEAAGVDAERRYKSAQVVGNSKALPADYDGEPRISGVGARDPYGKPPSPSRRAARRLERLPP